MRPEELDADGSPQLYRTLFQTSPDGILVVDRQGTILQANPRACDMFGYAAGELTGRPVDTLVPEPQRGAHPAHRAAFAARPLSRPMGGALPLSGLRRDGSEFPAEIALAPAPLEGAQVYIASVRDISDLVRTKQAALRGRYSAYVARFGMEALAHSDFERLLRAAATLVREAMEIDAVIVLRLAADGRRFSCEAASGLEGVLEGFEVPNDPRYLAGYVLEQRGAVVSSDLRSEKRFDVPERFKELGLHAAAAVPLFDRDRVIGVITARSRAPRVFADSDVDFLQSVANILATVLQRASYEEHIAHAQRLDALGQLTGGVAHDFNNLLMIVSGNLQVLEELVAPGQGLELARAALAATERGAMLTRKLLAFARKQPLRPRRVALPQLLADFRDLLQRTLGENVAVEVALDPAVPAVSTDPQELETALLNLALNARDAMPRGGRLAIKVERASHGDMAGAQPEVAAGDFACISVSDTGSGMPRAVLERAFEPFFTTKAAGKGSGLGLSMVYGFARQSGGTAQLHSEPDAGTTVRLYLPLAEAAQEAHAVPAAEAAQPGRETVLVVEDEPGVRRVAALLLGATGYRVLEAQDAESALRLLDEQAGRVDLLFTDVVLPGMNGIELARRARGAYPGLAVLFASGYASGSVVGKLREDEARRLLSKPYRREVLARAVRCVLEGRPVEG